MRENMIIGKWVQEEVKITSSRCFADFEGTFVTSNPRASILERNSTSSLLVNDSTYTIQVTEKDLLENKFKRNIKQQFLAKTSY